MNFRIQALAGLFAAVTCTASMAAGGMGDFNQDVQANDLTAISGAEGSVAGFKLKLGAVETSQDVGTADFKGGRVGAGTQKVKVDKAIVIGATQRIGAIVIGSDGATASVETLNQDVDVQDALAVGGVSGSILGFKVNIGSTNASQQIGVIDLKKGEFGTVSQVVRVKSAKSIGSKQRVGVMTST